MSSGRHPLRPSLRQRDIHPLAAVGFEPTPLGYEPSEIPTFPRCDIKTTCWPTLQQIAGRFNPAKDDAETSLQAATSIFRNPTSPG